MCKRKHTWQWLITIPANSFSLEAFTDFLLGSPVILEIPVAWFLGHFTTRTKFSTCHLIEPADLVWFLNSKNHLSEESQPSRRVAHPQAIAWKANVVESREFARNFPTEKVKNEAEVRGITPVSANDWGKNTAAVAINLYLFAFLFWPLRACSKCMWQRVLLGVFFFVCELVCWCALLGCFFVYMIKNVDSECSVWKK